MKQTHGIKMASILLALALAFTMPMSAMAVDIQAGTGTIVPNIGISTGTSIGFAGQEWYVIDAGGSGVTNPGANHVTLLVKSTGIPYGNGFYNSSGFSVYNGGDLYTAMTGIYNAINGKEQALITARDIGNVWDGSGAYRNTDSLPGQHVWPLSLAEWTAIGNNTVRSYGNWWWLRSPFNDNDAFVADIDGSGDVPTTVAIHLAARPAFNLNLVSALFTSAAASGKSVAVGDALEAATPTTGAVKLTVSDSTIAVSSATVTGIAGNTIAFNYAITGTTHNRLSAIVQAANGTVKYYGNLANTPGASGSASVTVPGGLAADDRLLIFPEQVNGTNLTDFAGSLVQLTRSSPAGLNSTGETSALNDGVITGTLADMEYSTNGITWFPCSATQTAGLAPGTYQVRYSGRVNGIQAVAASAATSVTIVPYARPAALPPPKTGDSFPLELLAGIAALALTLACFLSYRQKRRSV